MRKTHLITLLISAFLVSFTALNTNLSSYWNELLDDAGFDKSKQSFCFEENGKVYGENIDLQIKPASVTKLYTTLWSIDSLGKNFRFQTKIIVKNNVLYIVGGNDPFFVTENILVIMNKLASHGYTHFKKVYFSSDLFLNWSDSQTTIKTTLEKLLNKSKWTRSTYNTVNNINDYLRTQTSDPEIQIENFSVNEIVPIKNIRLVSGDFSFLFRSSPIWQHFKQVNMYSNNFYTDKIFDFLGGSVDFSNYIKNKIGADEEDIYLFTGSGLGNNYTTCRVTLNMLNALEELLNKEGILHEEIIAIPGFDDGTLKNRFAESSYKGKLAAKTGTLRDTSTLAGYLFSEDAIRFAVFNSTTNRVMARKIQNKFIKRTIDDYANIQQLNYQTPFYISIKDIEILDL